MKPPVDLFGVANAFPVAIWSKSSFTKEWSGWNKSTECVYSFGVGVLCLLYVQDECAVSGKHHLVLCSLQDEEAEDNGLCQFGPSLVVQMLCCYINIILVIFKSAFSSFA